MAPLIKIQLRFPRFGRPVDPLEVAAQQLADLSRRRVLDGSLGRNPTPKAIADGKREARERVKEIQHNSRNQRESL